MGSTPGRSPSGGPEIVCNAAVPPASVRATPPTPGIGRARHAFSRPGFGLVAILFGLIALVLAPLAVAAQQPTRATPGQPDHDGRIWRVAVAQFLTIDIPEEYRYLARIVPLLAYELLRDVESHRLSTEQRREILARETVDRDRSRTSEVRALLDRRDRLLFADLQPEEWARQYEELSTQIEDLRSQEQETVTVASEGSATDPGPSGAATSGVGAPVPDTTPSTDTATTTIPVEWWANHDQGRALEVPLPTSPTDETIRAELAAAAQRETLDQIVWGRIEYFDGRIYLEMRLFDALLGEWVDDDYVTTIATDLAGQIEGPTTAMAAAIAGEPEGGAVLTVVASIDGSPPPDADEAAGTPDDELPAIVVDGTIRGFGSVRIPFLRPGTIEIIVSSEGYLTKTQTVRLAPREERTVEVTLQPEDRAVASIASEPSGAKVYLGSVYQGLTPVGVSVPDVPTNLRLSLPGYHDSRLTIGPEGASAYPAVVLTSASTTTTAPPLFERVLLGRDSQTSTYTTRQAKDRFYTALGLFAVSVPVTLFLSSGINGLLPLLPDDTGVTPLTPEENTRLGTYWTVMQVARGVSIGANVLLLTRAIGRLVDYVRTGDASFGRASTRQGSR